MAPHWSKAEHEQLEMLLGDMPWAYVSRAYNGWAVKNGYPTRTTTAIERRMDQMGWHRTPVGEWITTGVIVAALGVSYEAPHWWIDKGWLPAQKIGNRWYLRRRDLVAMAKRRPEVFARFPRERLVMLLENEKLAERLAEQESHPGKRRPVQCVETGKVYGSIAEACRLAAYVSRQRLREVLNTNQTANGLHWRSV